MHQDLLLDSNMKIGGSPHSKHKRSSKRPTGVPDYAIQDKNPQSKGKTSTRKSHKSKLIDSVPLFSMDDPSKSTSKKVKNIQDSVLSSSDGDQDKLPKIKPKTKDN